MVEPVIPITLRLIITDCLLALVAGCAVAALLALLRRHRGPPARFPYAPRLSRWGARHADHLHSADSAPIGSEPLRYRLVEPAPATIGPSDEDRTALRFTL